MSLPRIKKEPSYVNTDLRELKLNFLKSNKPIEKSSTPRKSPKKEIPKSSTPRKSPKKEIPKSSSVKKRIRDAPLHTSVVSPRPNYHYINDINGPDENITFSLIHPDDFERDTFKMPEIKSKSKRKHERNISLPDVNTHIHGIRPINFRPPLPPIGKKAGKRRTRKHKSNRRRTLKK